MKTVIGIIGGREQNCTPAARDFAEAVGYAIGHRGLAIVSGGEDGIMEAASRGCKRGGGTTIGIMKWNHAQDANPFIDYAIPTSMDLARANPLIWTASGIIAFEGGYGTATEAALALDVGRPLIMTGDYTLLSHAALDHQNAKWLPGNNPAHADYIVEQLFELIEKTALNKDARWA